MTINPITTYTGTVPLRTQAAATFNTNIAAMLTYIAALGGYINTFAGEANSLASDVADDAADAAASAASALDSLSDAASAATLALAAANATTYSGSTSYSFPTCVVCTDGGTYRCVGSGVVGDNPIGSTTGNWFKLTISSPTANIKTANFQIAVDIVYMVDTTSGAITGTLPANPVSGQMVHVGDYAGTFATNNCTLGRNGKKIMRLEEDLVLNIDSFITLIYVDSTIGWRIIK